MGWQCASCKCVSSADGRGGREERRSCIMSEEGYSGASSSEGDEPGHIVKMESFVDDDGPKSPN